MKLIQTIVVLAAIGSALTMSGCNNKSRSESARPPVPSSNVPPTASVTFPLKNAYTEASTITVRGTANDDSSISGVSVNGVDATSADGFANWSADIDLAAGNNPLVVIVTDDDGATAEPTTSLSITQRHEIRRPYGFEIDEATNTIYFADLLDFSISTLDPVSGQIDRIAKFEDMLVATTSPRYPADIALDLDNNRIFATIRENVVGGPANAIGVRALNLESQNWSAFSDVQIDPNAILTNPVDLILDAANNRLLAIDFDLKAVVAINLDSGEQSVLSSNTVPNNNFALIAEPLDAVIDYPGNRLLLADRVSDVILGIDLSSGAKSVVSGAGVGAGLDFQAIHSMTLDSPRNRVIVYDRSQTNSPLVGVQLADGSRTIHSDNGDVEEFSKVIRDTRSLVMTGSDTVLAMDSSICHAVEVDLETRARRLVADNGFPRNRVLTSIDKPVIIGSTVYALSRGSLVRISADGSKLGLAGRLDTNGSYLLADFVFVDSQEQFAYLLNTTSSGASSSTSVRRVSLADGRIEVISDNATPTTENVLPRPQAAVLDEMGNRLVLIASDQVFSVDLTDGTRSVLPGDMSLPLNSVAEASLDPANNRILVADEAYTHLVAINLDDGERSMVSIDSLPEDTSNYGLTLLTTNNEGTTWALDINQRLVRIDGSTGQRSLLLDVGALDGTLGGWQSLEQVDDSLYVETSNYLLQIDKASGEFVKLLATRPGCPAGSNPVTEV